MESDVLGRIRSALDGGTLTTKRRDATLDESAGARSQSAATADSVERAKIPENANVAVLGAGPIGLCTFISAKAKNLNTCFMTEKIPERVDIAKKAGATWVGNPDEQDIVNEILKQQPDGLDVAFECAGQQETVDQCIEILRPGGTLVLTGIPRFDRLSVPVDVMRRKEITIVKRLSIGG